MTNYFQIEFQSSFQAKRVCVYRKKQKCMSAFRILMTFQGWQIFSPLVCAHVPVFLVAIWQFEFPAISMKLEHRYYTGKRIKVPALNEQGTNKFFISPSLRYMFRFHISKVNEQNDETICFWMDYYTSCLPLLCWLIFAFLLFKVQLNFPCPSIIISLLKWQKGWKFKEAMRKVTSALTKGFRLRH